MSFRGPAPDGAKGDDNLPLLVLQRGTVLKDRFKIIDFVASGGMSIVYSAIRDSEKYLIKEVEATESKKVIALTQEKFILERLGHPGIIKAYDLFEQDGFYYLVLDYIDGQSMDKLISPFPEVFIQEKVILDWALQLCDIMEYLHRQSPPVIYRDLKPKNLMKDKNGRVHLVDFGIARSFKPGKSKDTEAMGSALTASPEHYGGSQTDERSDIFTLGATLNYFLTNGRGQGEEPFVFSPVRAINPKISENMEQVIKKALELDPRKRYQSIREMRQAILNTRETPLPVMEPFGKRKEAEAAGIADKSPDNNKFLNISPKLSYLAMGLVCVILVVVTVLIMGRLLAPQKVEYARTARTGESASPPFVAGTPEDGGTNAESVATVTVIYGNDLPSPSDTFGMVTQSPTVMSSAFPIGGEPEKSVSVTTAPPSLNSTMAYPSTSHDPVVTHSVGEGYPPRLPGGDPHPEKAQPTIVPGENSKEVAIHLTRVYRDDAHNFEIVLPPGWVHDNRLLENVNKNNMDAQAAFSHLTHPRSGREGPDCAILVNFGERQAGFSNAGAYLEKWSSESNKAGESINAAEAPRLFGDDRIAQEILVAELGGGGHPEIREVRVGPGCVVYLRAIGLGRAAAGNEAEKNALRASAIEVLDSFSFLNP